METLCLSNFWDCSIIWHTNNPDFTPCFKKTFLVWIPCAFLWIFLPLEVRYLRQSEAKDIPFNNFNVIKLVLIIIAALLQVTDIVHNVLHENVQPIIYFCSPIIVIITFILFFILTLFNIKRGIRSSGILFTFSFLLVVCGIPEIRDVKKIGFPTSIIKEQDIKNISQALYYTSILIIFLLNCFNDEKPQRSLCLAQERNYPYKDASFLSKLFLTWFDPYIWKNYTKPMKNYLWDLDPKDCAESVFYRGGKKINIKFRTNKVSILAALSKKYGFDFWRCTFLRSTAEVMTVGLYIVFNYMITSLEANEPTWILYFYTVLFFVIILMQSFLTTKYSEICFRLDIRVKGAVVSCLYEKALRISNSVRKEYTTSDIVNLMSVDTLQLQNAIKQFHFLFSMCLQVITSFWYLWILLGFSVVINVIVMILIFLCGYPAVVHMKLLQKQEMKNKDVRGKFMQEIFAGIKVLKMYAWEFSFKKVALNLRKEENKTLKSIANTNIILQFVPINSPYLMCFVGYLAYILVTKNIMNTRITFVSYVVFNCLRIPFFSIPQMILVMQQVGISIKRMNEFLNSEEIDDAAVSHDSTVERLVMQNATFSWVCEKGSALLQNLNIKIEDSSLVPVVGPVGSGKSSLISAFLGEMYKISGYVNTRGKIAYVPQQAWILNSTIKENITLGENIDQKLYETAIEACALRPDIESFPVGDLTEIGEKGVNLSGGQKQRISLARAVCQNADIYFLDDPLSAVDSSVASHIFQHVLGPNSMLKEKTRVLVTHSTKFFPLMNTIIVLKNGRITEVGKYHELLNNNGEFTEFVRFYTNTESLEEKQVKERFTPNNIPKDTVQMKKILQNSTSIKAKNKSYKFTDEELLKSKRISAMTYWMYFSAAGKIRSLVSAITFLVFQIILLLSNLWIAYWISKDDKYENRFYYMSIYALFGIVQAFCNLFGVSIVLRSGVNAATNLHNKLLENILQWPMHIFDATPIGRIITRFSDDIYLLDNYLPMKIIGFYIHVFRYLSIIIWTIWTVPISSVVIIPLSLLLYILRIFYVLIFHQLKRIEANNKSPLYSHLVETVSGAQSIRAYGFQTKFISRCHNKINTCSASYHSSAICARWFGSRVEFIESLLLCSITTTVLLKRDTLDLGIIVLEIAFAIQMIRGFFTLTDIFNEIEEYMISVERIREYIGYPLERITDKSSVSVTDSWPNKGEIAFQNYKLKYREDLDYVLKDLSFTIKSGEKIGIVGRTGAGKSSVILGLFRIVEPADGTIFIDRIDITKLGLQTLRSRLTVIPQDPVLFFGTLRFNLDPFNSHSDEHLWSILEKSHLKNFVGQLPGGLHYSIDEGGQNLSFGQRQLICLARALLRKTKVLILDEATASVDVKTDQLIQKTIREEFSNCTVITIAHRLNTLRDYDKILILDAGRIVNFDTVENLMNSENLHFRSMVIESSTKY